MLRNSWQVVIEYASISIVRRRNSALPLRRAVIIDGNKFERLLRAEFVGYALRSRGVGCSERYDLKFSKSEMTVSYGSHRCRWKSYQSIKAANEVVMRAFLCEVTAPGLRRWRFPTMSELRSCNVR